MKLIFLGPPGVGKGTQAAQLSNEYDFVHLSTGVMLRDAVSQGSSVGKKVKSTLDSGALVPDLLVCELVEEKLDSISGGYILDGFPRTFDQAKAFEVYLSLRDQKIDKVISFNLSQDILVKRLIERGQKENRTDDTLEIINTRLDVYRKLTEPLIKHYKDLGLLFELDGLGDKKEVTERLKRIIER